MKVAILAGGGGTRLFPMSRTCYPKQFLKLGGEKSLLAQTVGRFLGFLPSKDIIVVTNADYYHFVKEELAACGAAGAAIICEPQARNTAPAIALAMKYCEEKLSAEENEVIIVAPSDHVIKPVEKFLEHIKAGEKTASKGSIVVFGVEPDKPETGYGYIKAAARPIGEAAYEVIAFKEKPALPTAEEYLSAGGYYWNAGIFAFTIAAMKGEFAKLSPEINRLYAYPYNELCAHFQEMPRVSIDFAVMEKSKSVQMVPLSLYWNDIGSWDALSGLLAADEKGNSITGDGVAIECENTMIISNGRLVAGIGLKNLNVIEMPDAVVIAQKGQAQKIKDLVTILKKDRAEIVDDNVTMHRPWGSYTVLSEGDGYKVKKIVVNPSCKLSLQMHYHRSEHWTVISGTGKLTLDDKVIFFKENESTFIPMATKHRLENPGRLPLSIIEVQNGKYLGEDDIVRFDDIYGRVNEEMGDAING